MKSRYTLAGIRSRARRELLARLVPLSSRPASRGSFVRLAFADDIAETRAALAFLDRLRLDRWSAALAARRGPRRHSHHSRPLG